MSKFLRSRAVAAVVTFALFVIVCAQYGGVHANTLTLSPEKLAEVNSFQDDVNTFIDLATKGDFKGATYKRLADFTDFIGHRLCGSEDLVYSVNTMIDILKKEGFDNVHAENVTLPHWVRNEEHATLVAGRRHPYEMSIIGLGNSVGTGDAGIEADVIVVRTFDELAEKGARGEAKGKIVVFNQYCDWVAMPLDCYGDSVVYRTGGASAAAAVGAVAALVRSVTGFSIYSPHAGEMQYNTSLPMIPTASVTVEDAEMLQRIYDRGEITPRIRLFMGAQTLPDVTGQNVVAEITGSTYPDEVVLVSGHLDSWDVGNGVMDDLDGAFISWSVLSLVKMANFKPKRTLRLVMWSCEEFGGIGSAQYFTQHQNEVKNMDFVMESDLGVFRPTGLEVTATNPEVMTIITAIGQLLAPINATAVVGGGEGTDIQPWMTAGVPGGSLHNDNDKYFDFHHSHGDTMTVMNSDFLDLASVVWASHAYVIASLDDMLPRNSSMIAVE